jgi:hypothetical protein
MITSLNALMPVSLDALRRETGALLMRLTGGDSTNASDSSPQGLRPVRIRVHVQAPSLRERLNQDDRH